MILLPLKILAIIVILALLCLPFFPHKFSFSLASVGYTKSRRWRNICFVLETIFLGLLLLCFAPLLKNLLDWLLKLGLLSWLIGLIPARAVYTVSVAVIILSNLIIAYIFLVAKKILRAFLDSTFFKNSKNSSEDTSDKKRKKITSPPQNAGEKKNRDSFLKRLKLLRRDSVLVFKNVSKNKNVKVISSDYIAENPDTEEITDTVTSEKVYEEDKAVTLGELVKELWFKFIGLFYNKQENFRYVKTSTFRWANELKYFLFLLAVVYLIICLAMLLPVFFSFTKFPGFYSVAQWLVSNTYLYPMISLILLFEILRFIDGEYKKPDEAKDPALSFAKGVYEEEKQDVDSHRKQLLDKYGQSYRIKTFNTDSSASKSSYNLNEKKQAVQNMAKAIRANKKIINNAYMQGIESMLDDKHILFDSSLYSSLGEYIIHYLFVKLSFGTRVLFICEDEKEIKKASEYLKEGFLHITKTNQALWRISTFDDMYKGEKPDILMLTPAQFLEKDLFVYGKSFFNELVDVFIPNTDKVLSANNYYCLIIAKKLERYSSLCNKSQVNDPEFNSKTAKRVRYRFLSNGHIHAIDNSIRQFFNLGDEPLETFNSFGLSSKNDVFVWHTGISSALYVDNGANQVALEVQLSKDASDDGVSNINLISETAVYNSQLNEIPGLCMNSCDISDGNTGYVIVSDDAFDLPNAIYNYSRYSGRSSSVLHVISKPYLLRDYFTARAQNYVSRFELIGETMCEHADPSKAGVIILLCDAVNGMEKGVFLKRAYELLGDKLKCEEKDCFSESREDLDKCVRLCYETAFGPIEDYQPRYNLRKFLNSRLETVTYVRFEDSNGLFKKLLESTKTVRLEYVNTQSVEYLSIFRNKITQHFIPGQIITRNNRPYTIKDISIKNGTLFLDDTGPSVNIPMDYIQTRIYNVKNPVTLRTFGPDFRAKDSIVYHVGFELVNADITVDTVGYYSIEKAVQNVDLAKTNFAKYINLRSNPELLEKLRRNIKSKMLVVTLDMKADSNPKLTYTLSVILNEMMKTLFPHQYRCISVCPLFDDVNEEEFFSEHSAIRDLYPTIILEESASAEEKEAAKAKETEESKASDTIQPEIPSEEADISDEASGVAADADQDESQTETPKEPAREEQNASEKSKRIRFAIIEDTEPSNGVIETLIDGEGIVVTNLLHVVADFLAWATSPAGKDFNYLNFGYSECPDIFDITQLEVLLRQFRHEIERSELVRKKDANTCFFCHKAIKHNEGQLLEDGRVICHSCIESSVNTFEGLEKLFDSVRDSILESTEVPNSFPKDISIDFVSTKDLISRFNKTGPELPIGYCNHATNSVYVEFGLPAVSAAGVIARLITELWQEKNIVNDGSDIFKAHPNYVEMQVLYALNYTNEADALSELYAQSPGLDELKKLLSAENTTDSFALLCGSELKQKRTKLRDPEAPEEPEIPEPEPEDPDMIIAERTPDNIPRFWYNRLSADEKEVYDQIYQAIMELKTEMGPPVRSVSKERIGELVEIVIRDNPDIFWTARTYAQTHYDSYGTVTNVILNYIMTKSEVSRRKKQIESAVKPFFKGINVSMSDYTVALLAHENIVDLIDYDSLGLEEQEQDVHSDKKPDNLRSIFGVFVEKKAVCAGYAKAFQYLMNRLGIECAFVKGQCNDGEWHAWNIVKLEGNYYYVDVTWDDRSNTDSRKDGGKDMTYDYFCITMQELLRSRNISDAQLYPECTATSCNYFVRSKLFFKEYDAKQVNKLLTAKLNAGAKSVSFKLSSPEMLRLFKDRLIEKQGFFDIIANSDLKKKPSSILHRTNEELNILHIYLN